MRDINGVRIYCVDVLEGLRGLPDDCRIADVRCSKLKRGGLLKRRRKLKIKKGGR